MKLTQPDRKSCGPASLIMARRLAHPDYAARICDQASFAREVTSLHRRITSRVDTTGRLQLPWPRALGTPPWAAARELRLLTGVDYGVHSVRLGGEIWPHLQRASPHRPAAVFIGDRLCPRHVVLVADIVDSVAWTYEPHSGVVTMIGRKRWGEGPLRIAGWDQPWFVVAADDPAISSA